MHSICAVFDSSSPVCPGQQSGNTDELLQSLSTLQSTVDILSSPLFSSLLEIKQQYKQVGQHGARGQLRGSLSQ